EARQDRDGAGYGPGQLCSMLKHLPDGRREYLERGALLGGL
ncbi:MAG: hypothetical protein AVDCRST_MAG09-2001, partial [uncultured Sphingomonas sp.]